MGDSSNPFLGQDDYLKWDLVKGWSFIFFTLERAGLRQLEATAFL